MNPSTPDQILELIRNTRAELMRGPEYLHDAELASERAGEAAQLAFDRLYMQVDGTVDERKAQARAGSTEERDTAFVAQAVLTRVKAKIRAPESALVSLQTELKHTREMGA